MIFFHKESKSSGGGAVGWRGGGGVDGWTVEQA